MPILRTLRSSAAIALAALVSAVPTKADDYPSRPVTLVVPFPPGGGVDATARVLSQKLTEAWHQQVVPDNRTGAGTTIGTQKGIHGFCRNVPVRGRVAAAPLPTPWAEISKRRSVGRPRRR